MDNSDAHDIAYRAIGSSYFSFDESGRRLQTEEGMDQTNGVSQQHASTSGEHSATLA
jgi:hypothetical protein